MEGTQNAAKTGRGITLAVLISSQISQRVHIAFGDEEFSSADYSSGNAGVVSLQKEPQVSSLVSIGD